jgi:group II intron reverse transcriptase/maturase
MREQETRRLKALGRLGEQRAGPEANQAALVFVAAETDRGGDVSLCDEAFSSENIECAIYKARANKGAPGSDGMTVGELEGWWAEHGADEQRYIRNLHYRPRPVRKVEIPKPNGGMRTLGIPCVKDRMIQQAVLQVIQPIIDATFSEHSYGFRPERSGHQAIGEARRYFGQGCTTVVDIDLKSYFDTVNHDILMPLVEKKGITDAVVLHIIRRSLISGIMEGGVIAQRSQGAPQGGPLSPLLSNTCLDVLDKELERRGHAFVRYADDLNVYAKSPRAAQRVMRSATGFLEGKLRLTVNQEKSEAGDPSKLKLPGFSLGMGAGGAFIKVHPASAKRLKDKVRRITKRNRGISLACMLRELRRALTGWMNYFGIARCDGLCAATDKWIRRRVRQFVWKQWKKVKTRIRRLRALGMAKEQAITYGNTRKGAWHTANTFLKFVLTNSYLAKQGLFSLLTYYTEKWSGKRTAVYRTVRTVV